MSRLDVLAARDVVGLLLQGKKGGKDMGKGALMLSRIDILQKDQSRTRSVEVTHRLHIDNVVSTRSPQVGGEVPAATLGFRLVN